MFKKGRWIFILLILIMAACQRTPENSRTKIYIVRNAERYPGFNGSLTWEGRARAGDLMRKLNDSTISRIYFTPFARSEMTADSLRSIQKIDTVYYDWDSTGAGFIKKINERHDYGRHVLVIAHRYAIPGILQKLGVKDGPANIPDSMFNDLFEVIINHGKVSMNIEHYGQPPMPYDTAVANSP
jgi:hypothetical protein